MASYEKVIPGWEDDLYKDSRSSIENLRCPPGVRTDVILFSFSHLRTVLGETPKYLAASLTESSAG